MFHGFAAAVLLFPTLLGAAASPLLCTRAGGLAREHHLSAEFKRARAAFQDKEERAEEDCLRRGCVFEERRGCVYPGGDGVSVRTVHVIHSNHFDAGYTDGVVNVLNTYFDTYFPRAVRVGAALRANRTARSASFPTGLHWLTQSYLVQLYLDCPDHLHLGLHCPTASQVTELKNAISAGDITWHAWPNNAELALTTAFSAAAGVALTHLLDDELGVPRKTVLSQRDVPGMERSTIPALRAAGIRAFSEGMNGRISPPNVPDVFVWQDAGMSSASSNASMLSLWHPRGYGVLGDYLVVSGSSHALAYVWRNDNTGPPMSAAEALADHAKISEDFPDAEEIVASTLDDFVDAILKEKNGSVFEALPKIQNEIGDSWIWGCASDPKKLAKFRAAQRQLEAVCKKALNASTAEACLSQSSSLRDFTRYLTKAPEHTWGLHVDTFGKYTTSGFENADFSGLRKAKAKFVVQFEQEWKDQRRLAIDAPLQSLAAADPTDHVAASLLRGIQDEFQTLDAAGPFEPETKAGWTLSSRLSFEKLGGWATLSLAETGAIVHFETSSSVVTASKENPLALLRYQTLTQADYGPWRADYLAVQCDREYGKPFNCSSCASTLAAPNLEHVWAFSSESYDALLLQLRFRDDFVKKYGAPETAEVLLRFPRSMAAPDRGETMEVELTLINKSPTRLGEALFFTFNPAAGGDWFMDKLGEWVSPLEVVDGGSRGLHGISSGVLYERTEAAVGGRSSMFVESLDAGVVVWSKPDPFPSPIHKQPDLGEGVSAMLFDNIWNTNYQFWYPSDDADRNNLFRFNVAFDQKRSTVPVLS